MNHRVGNIRNLRTIKALRNDVLTIDLGLSFPGILESWLKKDPNSESYRSFDIVDNRYLVLSKEKTSDYYENGVLIEYVAGKWYFDVEMTNESGETKTIFTGTVLFVDDITRSGGAEKVVVTDFFNIEGGNSQTIYLDTQIIDLGNSN